MGNSTDNSKPIISNRWSQYRNQESKGFILDFSSWLQEKVPNANKDAIELVTLVNLSSVCGKVTHWNALGPFKPNIFCLIIGPSGLANKTKLMVENGFDLIKSISEDLVFPQRFSIEGAIEYIAGREEEKENDDEYVEKSIIDNHPCNTMYRDEFSGLIKEKDKTYLSDIPEFLSELYNGSVQKRYTKSCKLEKSDKTYFSLISVTTPAIYGILPVTYFSQGLGNRFIYVVISPGDLRSIERTYEEFFGDEAKLRRDERLTQLLGHLQKMEKSSLETLKINKPAGELWLSYLQFMEKQSIAIARIDEVSPRGAYLNRVPGNALKLAMLHRISRFINDDLLNDHDCATIEIELEDVEWAIGRMENAIEHFHTMMSMWQIETQKDENNARFVDMANVSKAIDSSVDGWLSRKQLMEMEGVFRSSKKAFDLINIMIEARYLEEFDIGSKSPEELNRHGVSPSASNKGKGLRIGPFNPWVKRDEQGGTES